MCRIVLKTVAYLSPSFLHITHLLQVSGDCFPACTERKLEGVWFRTPITVIRQFRHNLISLPSSYVTPTLDRGHPPALAWRIAAREDFKSSLNFTMS
jgi:hypothetical protein